MAGLLIQGNLKLKVETASVRQTVIRTSTEVLSEVIEKQCWFYIKKITIVVGRKVVQKFVTRVCRYTGGTTIGCMLQKIVQDSR